MARKKTSPPETPITYTAWKIATGAVLTGHHGIRATSIREARWRNWFIQFFRTTLIPRRRMIL